MTAAVQELIESFEQLNPAEQQEAAAILISRYLTSHSDELTDDCLTEIADQFLQELDREEAENG